MEHNSYVPVCWNWNHSYFNPPLLRMHASILLTMFLRDTRYSSSHDAADGIVSIHFQLFYASHIVSLQAFFMTPPPPNSGRREIQGPTWLQSTEISPHHIHCCPGGKTHSSTRLNSSPSRNSSKKQNCMIMVWHASAWIVFSPPHNIWSLQFCAVRVQPQLTFMDRLNWRYAI
jgi:hypothetical protein